MRRIIAALALVGLTATSAYAGAIVVYDVDLGEEFAAKREIVAVAKDVYGETAVYDTGGALPESVENRLVPGTGLPEDVESSPAPEALAGRLPHTEPGTEWVKVGDHLVEVREDGVIAMTVYDVLP
ncbi:MAG TPA: hypothetical protein VJ994_09325 [Paracoccaceae bacterium]|nr:hypothetical protein [Paracoccaceae bacterium]